MDIIKRIATHLAECEAAPCQEMEPDEEPLLLACRDEIIAARACAEMMLQGTGQKIGEECARRVMEQHYPPQWIPVSERLPEDFREVLVTNGRTHLLATCSQWAKYDTPLWMAAGGRCYPTHWMPLPQPPEVKP